MEESVLYRTRNGVTTLVLNRPQVKNAVHGEMWAELSRALERFEGSASERVLVITGAGDAFCAGADLSDLSDRSRSGLDRMREISAVALRLHRLQKPTVAMVNGVAAGAGCNLALGCDLVVAGRSARFSEIFVKRALAVDFGGSYLLPRMIGLHRAKELAFFGDILSAAEAESFGLVNRVVEDDALKGFVDAWAERLARSASTALSLTKTLLNDSFSLSMEAALEREALAQTIAMTSPDASEAIAAFREKREPRY
ncbi:MAG: enoyl-CoA hydratase/isomerase family protein [Acidimicrobiales bacterium]